MPMGRASPIVTAASARLPITLRHEEPVSVLSHTDSVTLELLSTDIHPDTAMTLASLAATAMETVLPCEVGDSIYAHSHRTALVIGFANATGSGLGTSGAVGSSVRT